jgi:integrase
MRTVTIGSAAVVGKRKARDVARRILLRAQVGENPAQARARGRGAPTYEHFLQEYWDRAHPTWKASTQRTQSEYRRAHLDGAFPGHFIDQIGREEVARWFAEVTARAGPGAANRSFEILRALMNKAEHWGHRPEGTNPCAGLRTNRKRRMERHLTEGELARLGRALANVGDRFPIQCKALELLLLTGCRKSEIIGLRWADVRGRRLLLPDSKTGPRTVWLGSAARHLLDGLKGGRATDLVFPIDTACARSALEHAWKLVRAKAGLPGLRIHDLRHSFASFAAMKSETLPMIGKLLGHAKIGSTARYAHVDDASVLSACERIGALIEERMS